VHGTRSRFLTEDVLGHFDSQTWPPSADESPAALSAAKTGPHVDVGARLRAMW
jgi:hypothetical protein